MRENNYGRLSFRPVMREDCALLYEWANDPVVRAQSFHSHQITCDEHNQWFEKTLSDPSCFFFMILLDKSVPVGQIRFNVDARKRGCISISLCSDYRSKGLGTPALTLACERIFSESDVISLAGYVKKGNLDSRKMFEKAGFTCKGVQTIQGQDAYFLEYERKVEKTGNPKI
jgi:UDP-2,4-diacetamido-2,4,6-trideoxy-beta-L-altropyranose hydrolase